MSVHDYTDDEYSVYSDDNVTLISRLDVSHPLHLHPNDSAALTIVSIKLNGTKNYQVWSCIMLLALQGKNKIGFIDDTCKRSNTDEILGTQWDRLNASVLSWILNSIYEELYLGQIFSKSASHVWEELNETYDKVDESVTFNLHYKIHSLSQNGSSIADYYDKLNALNSILSRESLPAVRSAYVIISSEESYRVVYGPGTSQRSESSTPVANVPNRGNSQRSSTSENVSRLSKVTRPTDNGNTRPTRNNNRRVPNTNTNVYSSSGSFIDEQLSTLLNLLKDNSNHSKNVNANMADFGANQHMTYIDKELINVFDISHLKIQLAKDNKMVVAFDENKCYILDQDLNLKYVLGTGKQCGGLYYLNEIGQ
ncbi:ribonuclease H-like domain-containing protein, partial [Tanacetum coccineum]